MAHSKGKAKLRRGKGSKPPYKGREFELFALWMSIPFAMRTNTPKGLGLDDPEFLKLVNCKSRDAFGKLMHVSPKQLTEWSKREDFQKKVAEINRQSNVLRFKKQVDFSFTMATINEGDAARRKLWAQLYEGYKERSVQENPEAAEELKKQTQMLREIAGRK